MAESQSTDCAERSAKELAAKADAHKNKGRKNSVALSMVCGAKIRAFTGGGAEGKALRTVAEVKFLCEICKTPVRVDGKTRLDIRMCTQAPSLKSLREHYQGRHPAAKFPEEKFPSA